MGQQNTNEIILNWRNSLRTQENGERLVIAELAKSYQQRGFSAEETLDVLLADGYTEKLASEILDDFFTERVAEAPKKQFAMVIPNSYREVQAQIESALHSMGPEEFSYALCASEQPIVPVSQRGFNYFQRLAQQAYEQGAVMGALHDELQPYIEEEMLRAILLAEKDQATVKKTGELQFRVSNAFEEAEVDLSQGVSTGERFIKGRFAEFGLADEYMVRAAQYASPHERIRRAMTERESV